MSIFSFLFISVIYYYTKNDRSCLESPTQQLGHMPTLSVIPLLIL